MEKQSDIFNYYVGGMALLSTVISAALFSRMYLPGAQLRVLDEVLQETRNIYEKSYTDGLLSSGFCQGFEEKLIQLEDAREELKERTFKAISIFDEYIGYFQGLSNSIMRVSDGVRKIRSHLVTTSEQNRRIRAATDSIQPGQALERPSVAAHPLSIVVHPQITSGADESNTENATHIPSFGSETATLPIPTPEHHQAIDGSETSTLVKPSGFIHYLRYLLRRWRGLLNPDAAKAWDESVGSATTDVGSLPV